MQMLKITVSDCKLRQSTTLEVSKWRDSALNIQWYSAIAARTESAGCVMAMSIFATANSSQCRSNSPKVWENVERKDGRDRYIK
jgi:hypothetical protein